MPVCGPLRIANHLHDCCLPRPQHVSQVIRMVSLADCLVVIHAVLLLCCCLRKRKRSRGAYDRDPEIMKASSTVSRMCIRSKTVIS